MAVANLFPRGPEPFAVGVFGALHHATLRHKVLHPGKTRDVLNLIEDDECQDLSDSWDGLEPCIRLPIVHLSTPGDVEFHFPQDLVRVIQKGESDFNGLTDAGIGEMFLHAFAVRFVRQFLADLRQVVLTIGILNVG
jgi:hypothetical protein